MQRVARPVMRSLTQSFFINSTPIRGLANTLSSAFKVPEWAIKLDSRSHQPDEEVRKKFENIDNKLQDFLDTHEEEISRLIKEMAKISQQKPPTLLEEMLRLHGPSTKVGHDLLKLSECFNRIPPNYPSKGDFLFERIDHRWTQDIRRSNSVQLNCALIGLAMARECLKKPPNNIVGQLGSMFEPLIVSATEKIIAFMSQQFIIAEDIKSAIREAEKLDSALSFDLLDEDAITQEQAIRNYQRIDDAIKLIAESNLTQKELSIKVSAIFPYYDANHLDEIDKELVPLMLHLAKKAKKLGVTLNIDAEQQNRLTPSLILIKKMLDDPDLKDWNGLCVVVQAYGKRALETINLLYEFCGDNRVVHVRLVKGAYDSLEKQNDQLSGKSFFSLHQTKEVTDRIFLCLNYYIVSTLSDRLQLRLASHNPVNIAVGQVINNIFFHPNHMQHLWGMRFKK